MAFVYQAGGTGQFKNANSAPFRTAVNFYIGLIKDGLAAQPSQTGSGWCGAFGKEKVAIAFEGNWMLGYLKDTFPNLRYTLAPMPKGKTRGNLAFTVSYSMAKDSKNKAAAWTLLSYLTGKTGAKKWTSLGFALPARSDVKPVAGRGAFVQVPAVHSWLGEPGRLPPCLDRGREQRADGGSPGQGDRERDAREDRGRSEVGPT